MDTVSKPGARDGKQRGYQAGLGRDGMEDPGISWCSGMGEGWCRRGKEEWVLRPGVAAGVTAGVACSSSRCACRHMSVSGTAALWAAAAGCGSLSLVWFLPCCHRFN